MNKEKKNIRNYDKLCGFEGEASHARWTYM